MAGNKLLINQGLDDQMEIAGYRHNTLKQIVVWFFIVITLGLLRLFFFWYPHLMIKAMYSACSVERADVVIMKDQYEQWFVSKVLMSNEDGTRDVQNEKSNTTSSTIFKYFITKKVKYCWNSENAEYQKLAGLDNNVSCAYFHQQHGMSFDEQCKRRLLYGANSMRIHVTPIIKLLVLEVLSPFYIFQVFSCSVWFAEDYVYYAGCIILISIVSITATIYQTRKMQRALRNTTGLSTIVTVCRGGDEYQEILSDDLVPGDVIEIPRGGCIMQCDAVLVTGNCIVNESMLTGESVPITKTPLPNPKTTHKSSVINFNIKDHARHVLFCGSHVIQTRYYGGQKVRAVVYRTGFSTTKGELVRSILYPKPVDFKFNRDTYKFVGILAGIAAMGFIYTIILMVLRGNNASDIAIRALDLITIAVPPALPAALTVGIVFAQHRLKLSKIYCISPRCINVCGSLNTVCFDKTGTLTEDGLDLNCIVQANDGKFESEIHNLKLLPKGNFMVGMATCHSLTIIDGVLSGDPLELIMFESIGWDLSEPGQDETSNFDMLCPTVVQPKSSKTTALYDSSIGTKVTSEEIGIVRQFTFSSSLQRMSVIVRNLGADHFDVYTKGAPEMIASLCVPETIPSDFQEILMGYTRHGYRVLALAYKQLPQKVNLPKVQRIQREQVERGLTFLGLIVMENRLKPETTPTMAELHAANIRTIMVTGDNMLTALSVARECGMVDVNDRIILVQAFPPVTDMYGNPTEAPHVEYVYTDDASKKVSLKENEIEGIKSFDAELGQNRHYRFAITGKSWGVLRQHFPDIINKVVVRGAVFARMSPDQKAQLVECLQDLGYYVGMCGDGANDCGALKTAHAGISLSEAEASVASPFTSKTPNISCIPTTIREGRAALVTSFGIFKYMACYSLTQFTSVIILYWVGITLTDFEFLYIDLCLLTTLSITFSRTAAYERLSKTPPLISLLALSPILSMILQMVIILAVQVFFFLWVQKASWFVPWEENEDESIVSYENTAVYYSSAYQYIILAFVFSKGKPYRKTIFSNYLFLLNLLICFGFTLWINIYPTDRVEEYLELRPPPDIPYRLIFVGVAALNLILCFLLELFIIDSHFLMVTAQNKLDRCLPGSRPKYEEVEDTMRNENSWPSATSEDLAGTLQRLDSAFQSASHVNLGVDGDELSLSGSETGSIKSPGKSHPPSFGMDMDDIKLLDDDHRPHSSPKFDMNGETTSANGKMSTKL